MTITQQPRRTRRTHSEAFKRSLIEACGEPGASVAGVALANGINANQLRRWMRERGIEPPELSCLPLRPAASGGHWWLRPGATYPEHPCAHPHGTAQRRGDRHG
ncbi:transposase [Zoogloea sp.]|uniref:transposase n=1 Tax=Zoogloea sp. TaxID=49181 RepID=UPI001DA9CE46|nr:transposase [Zoogloea sp.]MBK6652705.1 transposase [Zoogloea sp.]